MPPSSICTGAFSQRSLGVSFLPAASPKALKAIRQTVRRWALHRRSDKALEDLARMFNPYIQGWINYYSAARPGDPHPVPGCANRPFEHIANAELAPDLLHIDG